jgi:hypothetical protein
MNGSVAWQYVHAPFSPAIEAYKVKWGRGGTELSIDLPEVKTSLVWFGARLSTVREALNKCGSSFRRMTESIKINDLDPCFCRGEE